MCLARHAHLAPEGWRPGMLSSSGGPVELYQRVVLGMVPAGFFFFNFSEMVLAGLVSRCVEPPFHPLKMRRGTAFCLTGREGSGSAEADRLRLRLVDPHSWIPRVWHLLWWVHPPRGYLKSSSGVPRKPPRRCSEGALQTPSRCFRGALEMPPTSCFPRSVSDRWVGGL